MKMAVPAQMLKKDKRANERKGPSLLAYDKLDEIGYGSYGFVNQYKLKEANSGYGPTKMAVKSIFRGRLPPQYLVRELRINLTVDHENAVRTFGVEETPNRIFIKMELANTDLSGLKSKVMKVETFFSYEFYYLAHQIMAGLAYLHGVDIAHRDIKPSNILVMVNEANTGLPPSLYSITLKLCDFGASKIVPEETEIATIIGTKAYMAPEVLRAYENSKQHSQINYKRADVFSAGVVLHEMWFGIRPFSLDQLVKDEEANLEFNELIEENLNVIFYSMLKWNRNQRYNAGFLKLQFAGLRRAKASETQLVNLVFHSNCTCDGEMEMMKWLIDSGAEVNEVHIRGMVSLHYASKNGHLSGAQLLIERGADVNRADNSGETPLHNACFSGHFSISKLLIERGADINRADNSGWTPLHNACFSGHLSISQIVIERGADVNRTDISGRTPLSHACAKGHLSVAQLLIERGADVEGADNFSRTPLHHACAIGHHSVAKCLTKGGADVNRTDKRGWTSLQEACFNGHLSVAQLLIEARVDVNRADNTDWTALHHASANGHHSVVLLLIVNGADVNKAENNGMSSLLHACANSHLSVAQLLIEARADVNRADINDWTALHHACANGHLSVAQLLIERGANLSRFDISGRTPLHLAQSYYHSELTELLQNSSEKSN